MKVLDTIKNKKALFFGDSITHNWEMYTHDLELTHKEDPNYKYGLGNGLVKKLNDKASFKDVNNVAVSGGCYANCNDIVEARQTFRHFPYQVDQAIDKIKNAEVIFIMFGTNDYSTQIKPGDYTDVATSNDQKKMSFYAGMNYGYRKIKEINPNAKVFVIGILNRTYGIEVETFNYSIWEYNLAIKHACSLVGFNYIDVYPLFKVPANFPNGDLITYSDDGLHPNDNGFNALVDYIINYEI